MFTLHVEKGDVTVLKITGDISLGEGTRYIRETIRELVAGGHKKILLDLKGVTYIDSSGIGELVASLTAVAHAGGALKLLHLSNSGIGDLIQSNKLHTMFEVFEDEAAAIRSFV